MGIAVVILFYLYFTSGPRTVVPRTAGEATPGEAERSPVAGPADTFSTTIDGTVYTLPASDIVYVNTDSLLDNYTYFKQKRAQLERRQERMQNELDASITALEKEIAQYQDQAGTMTPTLRQITEENLMKKQEAIMSKRQDLLMQFREEEEKVQDEIHADLNNYLKEFNRDKNFNFILGYSRGSGILLANDSLDITGAVLQGLNRRAQP
jgi:outer membrane protein